MALHYPPRKLLLLLAAFIVCETLHALWRLQRMTPSADDTEVHWESLTYAGGSGPEGNSDDDSNFSNFSNRRHSGHWQQPLACADGAATTPGTLHLPALRELRVPLQVELSPLRHLGPAAKPQPQSASSAASRSSASAAGRRWGFSDLQCVGELNALQSRPRSCKPIPPGLRTGSPAWVQALQEAEKCALLSSPLVGWPERSCLLRRVCLPPGSKRLRFYASTPPPPLLFDWRQGSIRHPGNASLASLRARTLLRPLLPGHAHAVHLEVVEHQRLPSRAQARWLSGPHVLTAHFRPASLPAYVGDNVFPAFRALLSLGLLDFADNLTVLQTQPCALLFPSGRSRADDEQRSLCEKLQQQLWPALGSAGAATTTVLSWPALARQAAADGVTLCFEELVVGTRHQAATSTRHTFNVGQLWWLFRLQLLAHLDPTRNPAAVPSHHRIVIVSDPASSPYDRSFDPARPALAPGPDNITAMRMALGHDHAQLRQALLRAASSTDTDARWDAREAAEASFDAWQHGLQIANAEAIAAALRRRLRLPAEQVAVVRLAGMSLAEMAKLWRSTTIVVSAPAGAALLAFLLPNGAHAILLDRPTAPPAASVRSASARLLWNQLFHVTPLYYQPDPADILPPHGADAPPTMVLRQSKLDALIDTALARMAPRP